MNAVQHMTEQSSHAFEHYRQLLLKNMLGTSLSGQELAFINYVKNSFFAQENMLDAKNKEQAFQQVVNMYKVLLG